MPTNITGTGTSFNLPNYAGELFTAAPKQTPFLSLIGGLSGGKTSNSFNFTTGQNYDLPDPEQPAITETASLTAPAGTEIVREQKENTCQIFQQSIDLSYAKLSQMGQLSGLNIAGQSANPASEEDFQVEQALKIVARNVEYSFLNGSYQKATNATTAAKTRGMFELTSDADSTQIDAESGDLTKAMLDSLFLNMVKGGAYWDNMHMFVGADLKQAITNIYASQFSAKMAMQDKKAGISAKVTLSEGYTWDDVSTYVSDAIDSYFMSLNSEWDNNKNIIVRLSQIEMRILNVTGIIDVAEITLNGSTSNLTIDKDSIVIRGNVNATT